MLKINEFSKYLSLRTEVRGDFNIHMSIFHVEHRFFGQQGTGGLPYHKFWIFDGKQHPKNIWFIGC